MLTEKQRNEMSLKLEKVRGKMNDQRLYIHMAPERLRQFIEVVQDKIFHVRVTEVCTDGRASLHLLEVAKQESSDAMTGTT